MKLGVGASNVNGRSTGESVSGNIGESSRIKARIVEIHQDTMMCKHLASGFKIQAFIKKGMELEVGQVVVLEYKRGPGGGGYIVVDELMQEIYANVLESQHIISDGVMYTSIIMENPETKERIHSIVPNTDRLFSSTCIIITGDKVKLKLNNGAIFSIGNI